MWKFSPEASAMQAETVIPGALEQAVNVEDSVTCSRSSDYPW